MERIGLRKKTLSTPRRGFFLDDACIPHLCHIHKLVDMKAGALGGDLHRGMIPKQGLERLMSIQLAAEVEHRCELMSREATMDSDEKALVGCGTFYRKVGWRWNNAEACHGYFGMWYDEKSNLTKKISCNTKRLYSSPSLFMNHLVTSSDRDTWNIGPV